jgi:L-ascorbate metabolism protein UlaG (beta-lactamase superfamily)
VARVCTKRTAVVVPAKLTGRVAGLPGAVHGVNPGDRLTVSGLALEVVPAYNRGKAFHPEGSGVGYVVTVDGERIYHAGDTDRIPEMKALAPDVALLPIGGTYTMDAAEAAAAVADLEARRAIPIHWGKIVGSQQDAERFRDACGVPVEILTPTSPAG